VTKTFENGIVEYCASGSFIGRTGRDGISEEDPEQPSLKIMFICHEPRVDPLARSSKAVP
jgi:hypothetical protein